MKLTKGGIIILAIVLALFFIVIFATGIDEYTYIPILVILLPGIVISAVINSYENKEQKKRAETQSAFNLCHQKWTEAARDKNLYQANRKAIYCFSGNGVLISNVVYLSWIGNESLCFFPDRPKADNYTRYDTSSLLVSFPLEKVIMFKAEGEIFHENRISGGGMDVGGAVVGGMLFGAAGAIVGGRESIKSEVVTHDNRTTELYVYTENHREQKISFAAKAYEEFQKIIPEKEGIIVDELRRRHLIEQQLQKQRLPFSPGALPKKYLPSPAMEQEKSIVSTSNTRRTPRSERYHDRILL